ncbi:MAG: 50S ribosomal protein L21e [Candidatus Bathyarchaeota archaeon]|nr:50S ribosomal protein L21e [Candidatus Bathyarchaeum tardum]WGM89651.1 MAG: 50S ribosomal protein L21e [Candidatus Bathyarchaeum tardum]WNZ30247.1 MAG: 50S ribosomal protein L21e [Candidatus Bathyarchaeota archaeon]
MGRKAKGYRRRTRYLLKRKPRDRGKTGLSKVLREYEPTEKVVIKLDPSVHKGMPHRRFHGRIGVIAEKRGRAYVINVSQGKAIKEITVRPEHITPHKGA